MTDVDYRNENRNKKDEEVTEKEQRCIIVMKARPEIIIIIKKKTLPKLLGKQWFSDSIYLPSSKTTYQKSLFVAWGLSLFSLKLLLYIPDSSISTWDIFSHYLKLEYPLPNDSNSMLVPIFTHHLLWDSMDA